MRYRRDAITATCNAAQYEVSLGWGIQDIQFILHCPSACQVNPTRLPVQKPKGCISFRYTSSFSLSLHSCVLCPKMGQFSHINKCPPNLSFPRPTVCNGRSELCNRSYGNVTFIGAHDSAFHSLDPFACMALPLRKRAHLNHIRSGKRPIR